jgi:flagellar hook-basal body complex protein FliE
MNVAAVGAPSATQFTTPTLSTPDTAKTSGSGFANSLDSVSASLDSADTAATNVALGTGDIATMTAAMTKASVGVQLTVAVRDRAVSAYQDIMRMQV